MRTVLFEEFLFRGVYRAYFKTYTTVYAYGIPALLFGLWHILSSLSFKAITIPGINFIVPQSVSTLGTVVAMSLAGVVLLWLRNISKSLVAPAMVHYAVNATGMILAFMYFR